MKWDIGTPLGADKSAVGAINRPLRLSELSYGMNCDALRHLVCIALISRLYRGTFKLQVN
jgi:hypothetical protein